MTILKDALYWIINSSKNPAQWSMTIKGIAALALVLGVDATLIDEGTTTFVSLMENTALFLSAVMTAYGFIRKVYLTWF